MYLSRTALIIIGLVVIIVILIFALLQTRQNNPESFTSNPVVPNLYIPPSGLIQDYNPINVDLLKQYDYHKAFYPLVEPTRRVPIDEIPPLPIKRLIDIPTRGYPDNYTQFGILIKEKDQDADVNVDKDNKILRLFGRQEYPGSNKYEYYTMISSCPDQIKIPLQTKRRWELYDGDTVYIPEINDSYKVKLYKYDAPKYYPDLI